MTVIEKLKEISESYERTSLERSVCEIVLSYSDQENEITKYIKDILTYGCISGICGRLVYTNDTHKFYDDNYNDIEEIRINHEEDFGQPIKIEGDLKNFFAWMAFEETIKSLVYELASEEIMELV